MAAALKSSFVTAEVYEGTGRNLQFKFIISYAWFPCDAEQAATWPPFLPGKLFWYENWTKSHRKKAASFPGSSPTRPLERGSVPLRGTSRTGPWKRTRLQQRPFASIPTKFKKKCTTIDVMVIQFFADFSLNPQKNHLSCKSYLSGKQSPWHWWWFTSVKKLKFHGHILCVDNDEPANIFALYEPSYGKRLPGRQQNSFSSQVGEWIDPNEHFSEDHIVGNAQDPAGWRCLTVDCSSVNRW